MKENLEAFVTEPSVTVLDALKRIDANKKGFLVVTDSNLKVLGTLTDGDIRRAFIKGIDAASGIEEIYKTDFRFLPLSSGISDAIDSFKNDSIKFLPVVDEEMTLKNIITKNQLHAILLQDIHADLDYDFMSLNENIIDYEIFPKPWGFYKTTVMNDYFQSKVISINPGAEMSLQSHEHREEYWIVAHGVGTVQRNDVIEEVSCGSSIHIPKGCKHRLTNTGEIESLIITEVQLGDYFGEDDIKRYEDKYGRV